MQIERPVCGPFEGAFCEALTDESVKDFTSAQHTHGVGERQRALA
jgi:hypothetical protein